MWMGTTEACEYLGIYLRTLYKRVNEGDIPAYKMGRTIRFKMEDLDAYIESLRIQPGELDHLADPKRHKRKA